MSGKQKPLGVVLGNFLQETGQDSVGRAEGAHRKEGDTQGTLAARVPGACLASTATVGTAKPRFCQSEDRVQLSLLQPPPRLPGAPDGRGVWEIVCRLPALVAQSWRRRQGAKRYW